MTKVKQLSPHKSHQVGLVNSRCLGLDRQRVLDQ